MHFRSVHFKNKRSKFGCRSSLHPNTQTHLRRLNFDQSRQPLPEPWIVQTDLLSGIVFGFGRNGKFDTFNSGLGSILAHAFGHAGPGSAAIFIRNFLSYRLYLDDDHSGLEKLCLAELARLLSGLACDRFGNGYSSYPGSFHNFTDIFDRA